MVQPRPRNGQVHRAGRYRRSAGVVSAAAGGACAVARDRAEDDFAGLRFEHFGARIHDGQDARFLHHRAGRMGAGGRAGNVDVRLRFAGDPTPFLVGTVVYLFCNVAFGVMAGAAIPNQAATIQVVATVCFVFSFLISGFMFPISNIPAGIRWVANLVPARYFIEITRDAFLRGGSWAGVWHAHVALALLGSFFLLVAWIGMRKMQVKL